jgi:hypothetical protein
MCGPGVVSSEYRPGFGVNVPVFEAVWGQEIVFISSTCRSALKLKVSLSLDPGYFPVVKLGEGNPSIPPVAEDKNRGSIRLLLLCLHGVNKESLSFLTD